MAKAKSAAQTIADQLGIKVKSAQRRIQREAAGKAKKGSATQGLKKSQKTKVNKEIKKTKAVSAAKKAEKEAPKIVEKLIAEMRVERVNYSPNDVHTVAVEAEYDFYGSDKRKRTIRFRLTGDEINNFMNAPNAQAAVNTLKNTEDGQFLENGKVNDFRRFSIEGNYYDEDYFD